MNCKNFFFLLAFLSFGILFSKEKVNHSLNFSLKKAEIAIKKSSFKKKIINTNKISLNQEILTSDKNLQTIAIKLDSIKELHQKNLLKKEVLNHTAFYKDFLVELKNANIDSNEFLFLENEILKMSLVQESKKQSSFFKILFTFLGVLALFCLVFVFKFFRRKEEVQILLTKQENVIKNLVLSGKTNKEIASELHISLSTVKTHLHNIFKKLNISNRNELSLKFNK